MQVEILDYILIINITRSYDLCSNVNVDQNGPVRGIALFMVRI